ncbi:MAG: methyltransferase domain-containing protein [Propionibacteriaceae bacterium]|nr:methyltransferase domain-containing protein [Propionibacteriaceae bacterium]
MTATSQPAFPQAALDWLAPAPEAWRDRPQPRALLLGRSVAPLAALLARRDTDLVACDTSRAGVRTLLNRAPAALPTVARPEGLPFAPMSFAVVHVHQSLHTLSAEALASIARVLAPGGHLAVSYTVRDDSVPWVRRLTAILRDVDPQAMSGAYGTESVDRLTTSPYYAEVSERSHRLWVPISRVDLLGMVARRFPDLDQDRLGRLMAQVGELYETSARVPEPLLLPYRVSCWRAAVDHSEFTSQLALPEDGVRIRL